MFFHLSKEDCLNVDTIRAGVNITRDIQSMNTLFEDLEQEDGSIHKMPYGLVNHTDQLLQSGVLNTSPPCTNAILFLIGQSRSQATTTGFWRMLVLISKNRSRIRHVLSQQLQEKIGSDCFTIGMSGSW